MFFSGTRKILKVSRDTLRSYPKGLWAKYKLSGTQEMTSYRHCGLNTARKKNGRNRPIWMVYSNKHSLLYKWFS